jgi:sugar phosphate isomerase/epimerase
MRLGVFLALFASEHLTTALDLVQQQGITVVEVGAGNYPGDSHCQPASLVRSKAKREEWFEQFAMRNIAISALSCHGNPLHPDARIARAHRMTQRATIQLASLLGIDRVNTFSGCPGGGRADRSPNWVTCAWPPDFLEVVKWQWEEVVIPYWKEEARYARDHGVRICLEMHPGFVVYNPETLLRLRDECGKVLGANLDPSHLFWQGMDPLVVIMTLGDAIYHVHAKDVEINPHTAPVNGVLDTKHYSDEKARSWIFRTVGYGHDNLFWKRFVSHLRMVGYDDVLSIEHEDGLLSPREGFVKAIDFLKTIILTEKRGQMTWA